MCLWIDLPFSQRISWRFRLSDGCANNYRRFEVVMLLHSNRTFMFIYNYAPQPLRLIVQSGLDVPSFATRRLNACHHARTPSVGEKCPVILPKSFTRRKVTTWDRRLFLPLRRKVCWGIFLPKNPNPRTWVPKASTLPLDHRSRYSNFNYLPVYTA